MGLERTALEERERSIRLWSRSSWIQEGFSFCQSYPALRCFLSPPNVRNRPYWYPRFRPIILRALHHILLSRPNNLQLLEDHQGELDPDGIHFNIMSGTNFVQDLHYQAVQLILQPPPDTSIRWNFCSILQENCYVTVNIRDLHFTPNF